MSSVVAPTPVPSSRLPWFLRPTPVFCVVQVVPLALWLATADTTFSIALQGAQRAPLGVSAALAYGLLLLAFASGSSLGGRARPLGMRADARSFQPAVRVAHYAALAFAVFSASYVVILVVRSDIDILAVILAAQANLFQQLVIYSSDPVSQVLIMGRHLVLAALITWFAIGSAQVPRPPSLPVIGIAAAAMFVFTSSRLTVLGLMLITALFLFGTGKGTPSLRAAVGPVLAFAAMALIFAAGVWIRSLATWVTAAGGGGLGAAGYEGLAYAISPVNYTIAFVEGAVGFVRGLGLENFFNVVYTVFNLDVDYSYRAGISWYYAPDLDRVGLLGEWYAVAGPLFWLPTLCFGVLAGFAYSQFRQQTLSGLLLYPVVLLTVFDSNRGFLLAENIAAANFLYMLAIVTLAHFLQRRTSPAGRPIPVTPQGVW